MTNAKCRITVSVLGIALLMTMLLGLGPDATAALPGQGAGLFADAAVEGDAGPLAADNVIRARLVTPNFDLMGGADDSAVKVLTLNLFDDATFSAVLDRTESNRSGSITWVGRLEGVEYGSVALAVRDGVMIASVNMPGALYKIRYLGDGVHAIQEMDSGAFPPEGEPITVAASKDALVEALAPMADDGSIIDVLVVYTDDARAAVGGTTAMETLIDLAMAETNTSYINSGVAQRVNLVHTEEMAYDESGFDWDITLDRLQRTSDGYLDNVHTLRDAYCADEVVLIVNDNAWCGLAYMMASVSPSFEDSAFALVHHDCATGYYSFGHEMGHNMGLRHDWYVDNAITPYTYAHGYVNAPDRWRTIMAYGSDCDAQGFSCTRIQYWSNPSVLNGGDPMGVPAGTSTACSMGVSNPNCDADNQQVLDNTALTVANFRDSSVCNAPATYSISGYVRDSAGVALAGVDVNFNAARPAVTTDGSGYYTQSGFDTNDYIVSFGEPGYFFSPMEDLVTVSGANATHDATAYPIIPASFPFSDDFESGDRGTAWAIETDYDGRAQISNSYPHWGKYSLLLDNAVDDGFYSFASAILALDLSGQTQADLSFWWRDFENEFDANYDGVFISDDFGATWYQALSFTGGNTLAYIQSTIDLDATAATATMSFNDHFLVKFQFYDNDQIDSDGYGIDDVMVSNPTTVGPVVYVDHVADDDDTGESNGNDDGIVNCGESIEMWTRLYNQGGVAATGVTTTISTSDPYITFTSNTSSGYSDVAGWGTSTNIDDFEFDVAPDMPFSHDVRFDLDITSTSGGPWPDSFDVTVHCGSAYIYLPIVVRNLIGPMPMGFSNGDFENGSADWTQFAPTGWSPIRQTFPGSVTPHGESWAVWLGGFYDDTFYIQQQVIVPPDGPYLTYWHWIASADDCGYDYGYVIVNTSTTVDTYNLCTTDNTGGWVQHTVDMSAYVGQSISLRIQVVTDGSFNSNLFVDDVSFASSVADVGDSPGSFDLRNAATRFGE